MRSSERTVALFEPVERYYVERSRRRGDVYGWGPVQETPKPVARLLVDPEAVDVPSEIDGIRVILLRVDRPEAI